MPKALCVLKSDILTIDPLITTKNVIIKNPSIIFECNTHLLPRTVCEVDNKYLQLIPYVTLVNKRTKEVFFYRKELKNTTGPLGQYSIGVAGHIQRYSSSLRATKDVIIGEITRILLTKTGLPLSVRILKEIEKKFETNNFGSIYCFENEMDRLHLAICLFIVVNDDEIEQMKNSPVSKEYWHRWASLDDVCDIHNSGSVVLENWSKIILDIATSENVKVSTEEIQEETI